jgi:hypothetical protein
MKKHTCKNCGKTFEYCRGCLLSPISYKEAGYCSKACYEESKTPKIEEVIPVVDVEVVIEEDTSTSEEENVEYPYFFSTTEDSETDIEEEKTINDHKQSNPENL